MAYPSPYKVGMSSLGYQWIASLLSDEGFAVERVFLPDDDRPPRTEESGTPLGRFPLIAFSLAYELELAGLIQLLQRAGIPPRRADRGPGHPKILLGGPLTFSNPLPATPFVDAMLCGEAEDTVSDAVGGFYDHGHLGRVGELAGGWVPEMEERLPAVARAGDRRLPARARLWSPDAELSNMFLIEGERGCHRACTFCVMRRGEPGSGMRLVTPETVLGWVPDDARKVGLVGAAISDHPQLAALLQALVDSGREVGVSSLRADRIALKPELSRLLRLGGYQTLTVASDAASQRLRRTLQKGTTEAHLLACAEAAREHRFRLLKVYMMVGLPDEGPEDIEELISFTGKLAAIHPVALGIAPFVPKRNTPMWHNRYAGIREVEATLKKLQRGLRGTRAELRPTSARWAWVEAALATGGAAAGEAVAQAVAAGGAYTDWRKALLAAGAREDAAGERPGDAKHVAAG